MARQTILQILDRAKSKFETSKTSATFSQGASDASKQVHSLFIGYVGKQRAEYVELIQQSKMSAEVANVCLTSLQNAAVFLEEKMKEFEKIHFIRQGELINNNSYVDEMTALLTSFDEAEAAKTVSAETPAVESDVTVSVATTETPEENVDVDVKESVQTRKRPDELDTKLARAARDLKNRRKLAAQAKAQEQEQVAETNVIVKSKKGKKSGRPKKDE